MTKKAINILTVPKTSTKDERSEEQEISFYYDELYAQL